MSHRSGRGSRCSSVSSTGPLDTDSAVRGGGFGSVGAKHAHVMSPTAETRIGRMTIVIECIEHLSSSVDGSFPLLMTNQMTEIAQPGPTTCRPGSKGVSSGQVVAGDRLGLGLALPEDVHDPPARTVEHELKTVDAASERLTVRFPSRLVRAERRIRRPGSRTRE